MDWTTLLVAGFLAFAWVAGIYESWSEDWGMRRSFGMFVFLVGATGGAFLDDFLSPESPLLPWVEPIAAVVILVGAFIAWGWKPSGDDRSAHSQ
jgi:hypothetical protein